MIDDYACNAERLQLQKLIKSCNVYLRVADSNVRLQQRSEQSESLPLPLVRLIAVFVRLEYFDSAAKNDLKKR